MKATVWMGKQDMRVETVPDPKIINAQNCIVKISSTCICGSDLHLYNGYMMGVEKGDVLGHEFMGEVVEIGPAVKKLRKGDRVIVPFPIACGRCNACAAGLFARAKTRTRTRGCRRRRGAMRPRACSATRT